MLIQLPADLVALNLTYLSPNESNFILGKWSLISNICLFAAENGHLEFLKWAKSNGCDFYLDTCAYAAKNGHLKVLKWARANGCEWDSKTCAYAAENGH